MGAPGAVILPAALALLLALIAWEVRGLLRRYVSPWVQVRFYGGEDDSLMEAIELFLDRREAGPVAAYWDRDEPDHAGLLHVDVIELEGNPN